MLKNEGLLVFWANVFRLKQIWLWKNQAGAAATVLSGFLAELEVHWDLRQNPEEPQLTSALCPISSLPVTRVHYCSSSRGHTLPVSGWNLFWTSVLLGLQYLKKKKKSNQTLKIRDFTANSLCPVFLENWKSATQVSLALFLELRKGYLYTALWFPRSPPNWLPYTGDLPASFVQLSFWPRFYPLRDGRPKGEWELIVLTHSSSFPSNHGKQLMVTEFFLHGILTVLGENKVYSTLSEKWSP